MFSDPIRPFSATGIPVSRALSLPPGLEFDLFFFSRVMDGPKEVVDMGGADALPQFSRSLSACNMVLITVIMEIGKFTVDMGPQYFDLASDAGFVVRKTPCPIWRLSTDNLVSYGRSFQEAICKLLILHRFPTK